MDRSEGSTTPTSKDDHGMDDGFNGVSANTGAGTPVSQEGENRGRSAGSPTPSQVDDLGDPPEGEFNWDVVGMRIAYDPYGAPIALTDIRPERGRGDQDEPDPNGRWSCPFDLERQSTAFTKRESEGY